MKPLAQLGCNYVAIIYCISTVNNQRWHRGFRDLTISSIDRLKSNKSTPAQFLQESFLVTALAAIALFGAPTGKALAMQSPKIGVVTCQPGSEIDPYSFWPKIRRNDVTKTIEHKYEELNNINDLASWLACRGFLTTIRRPYSNKFDYILDSHFSRLKNGKYFRPPLWGFDIPIFRGAWAHNIEIYFDSKFVIRDIALEHLWN